MGSFKGEKKAMEDEKKAMEGKKKTMEDEKKSLEDGLKNKRKRVDDLMAVWMRMQSRELEAARLQVAATKPKI